MSNIASILGVVPRGAQIVQQVTTAGVSAKKENGNVLSTSDQLKLSKADQEGIQISLGSSKQVEKLEVISNQYMIYTCA